MEQLPPFPAAPAWSTAVGVAGRAFVFVAVAFFLISIFGWLRSEKFEKLGKLGFTLGCVSLFGTFVCLASLFLGNQFQYEYVFSHAEADLALKYKIAAIWSGQQGSFLLWACTSAIFGLLAVGRTGIYRRWFTIPYAAFLAAIAGILAYETPFNIIPEIAKSGKLVVPPTGTGLTPSLQNYWVVIHPPTIFLGFGSLTVLFCWALSAMMQRNATDWVRMVRPWAILSTAILGLGLCMGGFWAYETLGWGGFWAWDPVENVSFVPWVFMIALIHGLIIQATKGRFVWSNLLLAGLPFLLFVYGTFLTRSGFLGDTSVHSFAEMNRVALWILLSVLGVGLGFFLWQWFTKGKQIARALEKNAEEENGVNREGLYRTGILLISGIAAATAFGMSAPVITLLINGKNSRPEEWLYHQVLSWAYIPTMIVIGLAPFASWRSMTWKALLTRVLNVLTLSIGLTGFALLAFKHPEWGVSPEMGKMTVIAGKFEVPTIYWVGFLIFLSLFAGIANIWRLTETIRKSPMSIGGFVSHIGLAVFMAGMILSRGFERSERVFIQKSLPQEALGYRLRLVQNPDPMKLMDRDNKLEIEVAGPDGSFIARPGLYYVDSGEGPKSQRWPHIQRFSTHDIYLALGDPQMNYWEKPAFFLPGETKTIDKVTVTYHGFKMVGQPGQAGTKFVGHFTIVNKDRKDDIFPSVEIGEGGAMPDMKVAGDLRGMMTGRIDAATKGAEFQLFLREAAYPIELFYKPMTSLVWAGAGILCLGGLMAAFYRRVRRAVPETEEARTESTPSPTNKDAIIPVS